MQEQKMILKIDNDGRVDMKIYTLQDDTDIYGSEKLYLSLMVDGKDICIPFTRKQAELFARRIAVAKNTL